MQKINFTWDLAIGHVIQIATLIVAIFGVYMGLISSISENSKEIEINKLSIMSVKEEVGLRNRLLAEDLKEVKGDLNWLVKREVEKVLP